MIGEKDIQIGDWLHLEFTNSIDGFVSFNFKVSQLRRDYGDELLVWGETPDGKHFGNMGDISKIQPIPLTAEILEKNGIKLEEVGDNGISTPPKWRNRFGKWVLRTQWKDTFIWYDRTAKYWHLHDMGAAKLLYVHELQHALRLCGIEKEIEL